MSPGLNQHTQHPKPGAVEYFNFNSALVLPKSASVQMWLQKSLLVGKGGGKALRWLSSTLFGVSMGAGAGILGVILHSERGWEGGTAVFGTFLGAVGRLMQRVSLLICVASCKVRDFVNIRPMARQVVHF